MAEPTFSGSWLAEPASVPVARHSVTHYLQTVDTRDPPLGDIALAVSEAVTNVVHHAYAKGELGEVRVKVRLQPDDVELVVEDDGGGMMPRPDSPGLGLGLPLIATIAERFDTRTDPGGGTRLCMWFPRNPEMATLN